MHWSKYRVVLYTSTVGAGMNYDPSIKELEEAGIDNPTNGYIHFDRIIVMAQHKTIIHDMIFQMIHRVRKVRTNTVDILIPNAMSFEYKLPIYDWEYGISHLNDVKGLQLKRTDYVEKDGRLVSNVVIDNYALLHGLIVRDNRNTYSDVWLSTFVQLGKQKGHSFTFDFVYKLDKNGAIMINKNDEKIKKKQDKLNDTNKRTIIVKSDNIKKFHLNEDTTKEVMEDKKFKYISDYGFTNEFDDMKDSIVDSIISNKRIVAYNYNHLDGCKDQFQYDLYDAKISAAYDQLYEITNSAIGIDKEDIKPILLDYSAFTEILNNIIYPEHTLKVIRNIRGNVKLTNNIDIFKMCLTSSGYLYKTDNKQTRINGTRQYVITKVDIEPKVEAFELERVFLRQILNKHKIIVGKKKNNDCNGLDRSLTPELRKSIINRDNILASSGKYDRLVNSQAMVNEIHNLYKIKRLDDKNLAMIEGFLKVFKEYPPIDELLIDCDIELKGIVTPSKRIVKIKKLVNVKHVKVPPKI